MQGYRYKSNTLLLGVLAAAVVARAESPHPLMPASGPYRIYEMPERTDLLTPEGGRKQVYGNFGPDGQGSYRIEIPLEALKPSPTPTPTPTLAPPTPAPTQPRTEGPTPIPTQIPSAAPTATATPLPTPTVVVCAPTPTSEAKRKTASDDSYGDIDPLVVKANHLFNQRRFVESSEYVDEVLRRRPDYVRGWLMRGSLHKMLGHQDLAAAAFAKAKELSGEEGQP